MDHSELFGVVGGVGAARPSVGRRVCTWRVGGSCQPGDRGVAVPSESDIPSGVVPAPEAGVTQPPPELQTAQPRLYGGSLLEAPRQSW